MPERENNPYAGPWAFRPGVLTGVWVVFVLGINHARKELPNMLQTGDSGGALFVALLVLVPLTWAIIGAAYNWGKRETARRGK